MVGPARTASHDIIEPGSRRMESIQIISIVLSGLNTAAAGIAAAGIWFGIRAMVRSNDKRGEQQDRAMALQRQFMAQQRESEDRRHKEAMEQQREFAAQQREALAQQREAEDRRHKEAMEQQREALAQQREAEDRRHGEAMEQQREFAAQQREALAQQDRRHEESMAALKELIRRTAAPGSGTGE